MKSLGNQLIIELYNCDCEKINDVDFVEKTLVEASIKAKATIIDKKFHKFSPHGVSGAVIIAESHFAIHTWPEYGYCAVDIFTCGDLTNNPAALEHIKEEFNASYYSATEMKRGILNIPEDQLRHKPEGK
jgi:S-adenosylmethionine decarboxylase